MARVSRKIKSLPELRMEPGDPGLKPSTLSTRLSFRLRYMKNL